MGQESARSADGVPEEERARGWTPLQGAPRSAPNRTAGSAHGSKPAPDRSARLSLLLGLGTAGTYTLFSALAALQFPRRYGPWNNNTLSQLGNTMLNPRGAVFYSTGCALAGLLSIAFFLSLDHRRQRGTSNQRRILFVVRTLGSISGFGLFMNALFPENDYAPHHFWAGIIFNAFAAAMLLAPIALWRSDRFSLPIAVYCLLAFAMVIAMFIFSGSHWVEWLPVSMFLVFPSFIGIILHSRAEA